MGTGSSRISSAHDKPLVGEPSSGRSIAGIVESILAHPNIIRRRSAVHTISGSDGLSRREASVTDRDDCAVLMGARDRLDAVKPIGSLPCVRRQ
ncbi:Hypothetical protein MexAM1_META1p0579 [Methylorubrum extorquens AM1]|uniref:Uncharacterized protein n=1 Tax=Methylorubrum extorquens (strain ATCC 14718 / DSM 1338 / JCM 2805 / NCIMB 9133 / AM1) TaxID=272630 RepID=C5AUB9_METEA|nr:Hypothetical protein MexAM1_META1p0579 [Methylorubrum extorquens AM1]